MDKRKLYLVLMNNIKNGKITYNYKEVQECGIKPLTRVIISHIVDL